MLTKSHIGYYFVFYFFIFSLITWHISTISSILYTQAYVLRNENNVVTFLIALHLWKLQFTVDIIVIFVIPFTLSWIVYFTIFVVIFATNPESSPFSKSNYKNYATYRFFSEYILTTVELTTTDNNICTCDN